MLPLPTPAPAVLWFVNGRERKTQIDKKIRNQWIDLFTGNQWIYLPCKWNDFFLYDTSIGQKQPQDVLCKKSRSYLFRKVARKKFVTYLYFNKIATSLQVFSCELCEIFKNTFFIEVLKATTSD